MKQASIVFLTFIIFGLLVSSGFLIEFDLAVTHFVQSFANRQLDYFFSYLTFLGSTEGTFIIALAVAAILYSMGHKRAIILLLSILFLSSPAIYFFKHWFPHLPPPSQFHRDYPIFSLLDIETPYSFPSGHTARAAFVLGFILYPIAKSRRFFLTKLIIQVSLSLIILLIGYSRIYLGHHWASDVIGGYLFAGLLVMFLVVTTEKRRS